MGTLLLLGLTLPLVFLFLLWKYSYWYRQGVAQGNPLKLFGDMNDITITRIPYYKMYLALGRKFSHKPFYGTYSATIPALMIRDEQIIKDIFTTKFNSFGSNGFEIPEELDPIVSRDPFFQPNGQRWKETRTFFSSLMTPGRLRAMLLDMIEVTKETMNYLREHRSESGKGDGVNIKRIASYSMTNLLIRLTISLDAGCFKERSGNPFLDAEKKLFDHWVTGFGLALAMLMPTKLGLLLGHRVVPQSIIDFYSKVVRDQKEYRKANAITRNDVLDTMMKKSNNSQNCAESAELDTIAVIIMFIVEGFETTSTTMASAIVELARNPEIQGTLRQQILRSCPLGTDINEEALSDISLLHNCFLEALRLYPPLMVLQRYATEDVNLEAKTGEKINLKKGTKIQIPVYATQRDPQYFPGPEKFDPDRFDDESQKRLLLSFGDGPRLCPGQRFALQASKILLAMILREFKIELSPKSKMPLVPANNPMLYSMNEIWVRFVSV